MFLANEMTLSFAVSVERKFSIERRSRAERAFERMHRFLCSSLLRFIYRYSNVSIVLVTLSFAVLRKQMFSTERLSRAEKTVEHKKKKRHSVIHESQLFFSQIVNQSIMLEL